MSHNPILPILLSVGVLLMLVFVSPASIEDSIRLLRVQDAVYRAFTVQPTELSVFGLKCRRSGSRLDGCLLARMECETSDELKCHVDEICDRIAIFAANGLMNAQMTYKCHADSERIVITIRPI